MRGAVLAVACLLVAAAASGCLDSDRPSVAAGSDAPPTDGMPLLVTIAHVDTGVNPYHVIWRTNESFAWQHPSTYLPGYPADARPLNLTFDAADWQAAVDADAAVWDAAEQGVLYYVPGTRIVGMINLNDPVMPDDHGHGTMTASRSAGPDSLAPAARFVSVQGLGANGVAWIAEQGWIDVQTNSWGSLVPLPGGPQFDETPDAIREAATRMPIIFASGNGNGFNGAGPNPTWSSQTAPAGAVQVGAHDNGHVELWHGQPAHVVADSFGGPHAVRDSFDGYGTFGIACCTSAAAPYAAGGMAALILAARIILDDGTPGITDGPGGARVLAEVADSTSPPGDGPLSDGVLTLDELVRAYLVTAQIPVREGPHDGAAHWATSGTPPDPTNPAGNPYCQLCWGTPVAWEDVPEGAPAFVNVGYGSIDPWSVEAAKAVLQGGAAPARDVEDAWFGVDAAIRDLASGP